MAPTVGLHCLLLPLPSARSRPTSVQLSRWPLDFIPRKFGAVCMLAPPRPGSVTSPDCPDEEMSLHFGSLSLFLGPVAPASSQMPLPAIACCLQGFQTHMVHLSFVWGFFKIFLLVESVPLTEHK